VAKAGRAEYVDAATSISLQTKGTEVEKSDRASSIDLLHALASDSQFQLALALSPRLTLGKFVSQCGEDAGKAAGSAIQVARGCSARRA